jgi:hypothetical protein
MSPPANRNVPRSRGTRNSTSSNLILLLTATLICPIAENGSADAGIGQPISLGQRNFLAMGSAGPHRNKGNDFGFPGLAVVNYPPESVFMDKSAMSPRLPFECERSS